MLTCRQSPFLNVSSTSWSEPLPLASSSAAGYNVSPIIAAATITNAPRLYSSAAYILTSSSSSSNSSSSLSSTSAVSSLSTLTTRISLSQLTFSTLPQSTLIPSTPAVPVQQTALASVSTSSIYPTALTVLGMLTILYML
jgi:hypothetical protein